RSRRGPSCSCPPTPVRVPCPEASGIPQVACAADQAVTVLLRTCLPVWLRRCLGSRPPLPSHPCTRNLAAVDRGGGRALCSIRVHSPVIFCQCRVIAISITHGERYVRCNRIPDLCPPHVHRHRPDRPRRHLYRPRLADVQ